MDSKEEDENKRTQTKIRSCIQSGLLPKETFVQLCSHLNYSTVQSEDLDALFHYVDEALSFPNDFTLDNKYSRLLCLIVSEYGKLRNGIVKWPFKNAKNYAFTFLDSRYVLFIGWSDTEQEVFLLDNFHGQKR
jgi:hypothetical protein